MYKEHDDNKIQEIIKKRIENPQGMDVPQEARDRFLKWLSEASDISTRIPWWQRIFDLDRIQLSIPTLALRTVLATATATIALYLLIPVRPVITNVNGTVKIFDSGSNVWMFARGQGQRIGKNDIVKTFADGQAEIIVPGLYHMKLRSNTEILLKHAHSRATPGCIEYTLSKGKVFAYYKKAITKKRNFNIITPEAKVSVIGTNFMVNAVPKAERTWVGVLDGIVRVSGHIKPGIPLKEDLSVLVNPGQKTIVKSGQAPLQPKRLLENELIELEELYRIGTKPQIALLISTGATRTRELLSVAQLYIAVEKPSVLPERLRKIAYQMNKAYEEKADKGTYLDIVKDFENIVNEYPDKKYDVQFLLFTGGFYYHLKEYEKAVKSFQRVIDEYPRSSLVSIAQCAIAIIYEENIHDKAKALESYQSIISNYPRSAEWDEAHAGVDRLSK